MNTLQNPAKSAEKNESSINGRTRNNSSTGSTTVPSAMTAAPAAATAVSHDSSARAAATIARAGTVMRTGDHISPPSTFFFVF